MTADALARRLSGDDGPAIPIGLASLASSAFAGADLAPIGSRLIERVMVDARDAAALMDLSTILQLVGDRDAGMAWQAHALEVQRVYRRPPAHVSPDGVRVLAFLAPGDFMANTPLEFLLEGSDVTLDMCYVVAGAPLAQPIPDHDIAFVAAGDSDGNRAVLRQIEDCIRSWPCPVLNRPEQIAALAPDSARSLLEAVPGLVVPMSARIGREMLGDVGRGATPIDAVIEGGAFPIIVRPAGSRAGAGGLDDPAAVAAYLRERPEHEFHVVPFVDYRGADGLFRKYRIAMIDGRPYACQMAICDRPIVHHHDAGMRESAEKRAEEARFMMDFDGGFARRHEGALRALCEHVGLDYFAVDCGETRDGKLLLFEVDVAMIIHSMEPPQVFPYKAPQMRKVRDAFCAMLRRKRVRPTG
jgi:hypothetical protein